MGDKGSHLLERIALTAIGLILVLFLGYRLGLIPVFWRFTFLLIVALVLLANLFWWAWVDRQLRSSGTGVSRRRMWPRWLWAGFMALMLSPLLFWMTGARRVWDSYPVPLIGLILVWHFLMVVLVAVWAPVTGLRAVLRRTRSPSPKPVPVDDPANPSRRELLVRAIAATPMILAGGSLGLAAWQDGRFIVRRISVRLPRLPDRLRGLTITHISDMHVGRLFRPEHLPRMVDAANKLNSDQLAVTGDMVDHSIEFLPPACEALRQIKARCGRFMVIGNHDLLASPKEAIVYLERHEPYFLADRTVPLLIDGETIQITGLFWSRYDEPKGGDPGHVGRVKTALSTPDPQRCTIALAHHPHAFDPLAERGVDLTLAGHTHGGQLMLTPPGSRTPIGGGSLLFRYIWGEYRRGNSILQVTSGVGNWFPVRVNAPAEIVQIQLV
jgi:hypothetical protein